MTNLIFAFMQAYGGDERESLLLARSLREFGGKLASQPLWLMMPQKLEQASESARKALRELDVQIHRFEVPDDALKFPFGGKVYAAAAAEFLASNQADILSWMDSDTIFMGEPAEFLLGENISLGYRPVMLKNISLLFDEPLNAFWSFIYERCGTPVKKIYPMVTTIDAVRIRPQFNAGIMSLRPKKKLLGTWRDNFEQLYQQPELTPYYDKHILYRIFVHQSILSATILTMLSTGEIQDLGPCINYPLFLASEPDLACKAVTLRYDEFGLLEQLDWKKKVILNEPLQKWLQTQVQP